jgi:hypothetical protein
MEECEMMKWKSEDPSVFVFDVAADLFGPNCAAS